MGVEKVHLSNEDQESIKKQVKEFILSLGLDLKVISKNTGIKVRTLQNYAGGLTLPSFEVLALLNIHYGMDINQMIKNLPSVKSPVTKKHLGIYELPESTFKELHQKVKLEIVLVSEKSKEGEDTE